MAETRTYNGFTYQRAAPGEPWQLVGPAQGSQPTIIRNPWKAKEEARKDEDQGFDRARIGFEQERLGFERERLGRDEANRDRDASARQFSNKTDMRKEFASQAEVKAYKIAMQQLDQALRTGDGPQADLALTYAFAKAMDPESVVRDSEQQMQTNSQPWFQAAVEAAKKQFGMDGAGSFTPEARAALRDQLIKSVTSRRQLYQQTRQYYTDLANDAGFDPYQIVGNDTGQTYSERLKEYGGSAPMAAGLEAMPGVNPNAGGNGSAGGGGGSSGPYQNDPSGNRTFLTERDKAFANEASALFKKPGVTRADFDALAQKYNAQPFGPDLDKALRNPAAATAFAPQPTGLEEAGLTGAIMGPWANSGFGSYAIGAGNALTAGQLGNIAQMTGSSEGGTAVAMDMAQDNAVPFFLGELGGGALATLGVGKALGAGSRMIANPSVASILANPLTADATYGAAYGASEADDPLYGAVGGALTALGGSYLGGKIGRMMGGSRIDDPLNKGERAVINAMDRGTGISVEEALQQGQDLGLPMTLADVSPEVAALAGSAIRRNPTVAGQARDMLQRRGLGQIDRFRGAVARDLGPLDNVPQRADELIGRARTEASPLYQEAYANPVISTPEIGSLLQTPFGQQALSRARTIAANERRNPQGMGFALDADGNVILNPIPHEQLGRVGQAEANAFAAEEALRRAQSAQLTGGTGGQTVAEAQAALEAARADLAAAHGSLSDAPTVGTAATTPGYTTQTLDYTKRGMDSVLEQYRNDITGKLELDELGRSENAVLRALLGEMDTLNPAYGKARAAYAGPAAEREALYLGKSALTENPDLLAIQAGRQTPERLELMQLGARDRMVKGAENLSNSTNPFRVLNTPAMEQRLNILYPDAGDDVARLLLQRDLENKMAGTSNFLAGNSSTAERGIADQAFADEGLLRPILEGGIETGLSGAPVMTIGRRLGGQWLKDRATIGAGQRGMERAEQIAPVALNPDPADTIAQILAMQERQAGYQAAVEAAKGVASRRGGHWGTAATTATYPYWMGD